MSKGITGNIKHSNGLITTYKRKNELNVLNKRKIKEGFPKEFIFLDKEEINKYFSGDKITCLMCGNNFKALSFHLASIHGMTTENYKDKYGLPRSRGLFGSSTLLKKQEIMIKMIENGTILIDKEKLFEYRKKVKNRKGSTYKKKSSLVNLNKCFNENNINIKTEKIWNREDYYKVLDLSLELKISPIDLMNRKEYNLPKRSSFHNQFKIDHELKNKYYETINKLPFEIQSKHHMIGNSIKSKLIELRDKELTNEEIAKELKISLGSVINIVSELNLPKIKRKHCYKGHLFKEGKRTCQICQTENRRRLKGHLPRKIAAITMENTNCHKCNIEIIKSRLSKNRIVYCENCKKEKYYESQKKYAKKDPEKRKFMARIAYKNRKLLNNI